MSAAIERTNADAITDYLVRSQKGMSSILPKHLTPERMCRLALTAMRTTPKLAQCTPASFVGSVLQSAMLGLEPNTPVGLSYLVPFKDQCTLIVGYKGYMALAQACGARVIGRAVFDGDIFSYGYGTEEFINHVPKGELDPRKLTHTYAIASWQGQQTFVVLTRAEIEQRKARSRSANRSDSPWRTDYPAMAKKSAVRALAAWMPQAPQLVTAAAIDEAAEHRGTQFGAMSPEVIEALGEVGLEPDDRDDPKQADRETPFEAEPDWDEVEAEVNAGRAT